MALPVWHDQLIKAKFTYSHICLKKTIEHLVILYYLFSCGTNNGNLSWYFKFYENFWWRKICVFLKPQMFHIDCKISDINCLIDVFQETHVTLCSVHLLCHWMNHLKEFTIADYYKNPTLIKLWRILSGYFFKILKTPNFVWNFKIFSKTDKIKLKTLQTLKITNS